MVMIPLQCWWFIRPSETTAYLQMTSVCFINDYSKYIVIPPSQYYVFVKVFSLCSGPSDHYEEWALRDGFNKAICSQAQLGVEAKVRADVTETFCPRCNLDPQYWEGFKKLFLVTLIVFECFNDDPWASFFSKWIFMFAFCVSSFVNTALADKSSCLTMVTGVYFRIVTFGSFCAMERICPSMKDEPKSKLVAKSPTVVSITDVINANSDL